jgi:hypothetical protein
MMLLTKFSKLVEEEVQSKLILTNHIAVNNVECIPTDFSRAQINNSLTEKTPVLLQLFTLTWYFAHKETNISVS